MTWDGFLLFDNVETVFSAAQDSHDGIALILTGPSAPSPENAAENDWNCRRATSRNDIRTCGTANFPLHWKTSNQGSMLLWILPFSRDRLPAGLVSKSRQTAMESPMAYRLNKRWSRSQ